MLHILATALAFGVSAVAAAAEGATEDSATGAPLLISGPLIVDSISMSTYTASRTIPTGKAFTARDSTRSTPGSG